MANTKTKVISVGGQWAIIYDILRMCRNIKKEVPINESISITYPLNYSWRKIRKFPLLLVFLIPTPFFRKD